MFRLLRYFSLVALPCIAVAAFALGWLYRQAAERELVRVGEYSNIAHAVTFANAVWPEHGDYLIHTAPTLSVDQLKAHPATARLHAQLSALAGGTPVAKVKIFSTSGLTLYSSEAKQIGESKYNTPAIEAARAGSVTSQLSFRPKFQAFHRELDNRDMLSSYIPIRGGDGTTVVAVFELYEDMTPLLTSIHAAQYKAVAMSVLVMLTLYVALLVVVRHGARTIEKQRDELLSARDEIARTRDDAQRASRAKSLFLANMSHEIRTPMHGILGMAELLSGTGLDPTQRKFVETIRRSGKGLLTLLNEALDLSKVESGKLQIELRPFELRALVDDVVNLMVARATEKQLTLAATVVTTLPQAVKGDAMRLRQVLANLLGNAIKFTERGAVGVRVQPVDGDHRRVRFEVRDSGIGIGPEQLERLFQPFEQADSSTTRRFGGTGLGLSISKQLIELMGGTIGVQSTTGRGTTFWFEVPLEAADMADVGPVTVSTLPPPGGFDMPALAPAPLQFDPPPPAAPVPRPAAASAAPAANRGAAMAAQPAPASPALARARVLLAEDNAMNVAYAEAVLKSLGVEVVVASDGARAGELARTQSFSLILMDCQMPNVDGFAATAAIRAHERHTGARRTPIVALTANAMSDDRERCLAAGMDDFLSKPFRPTELQAALERWIAHPATTVG
jgi:signal transduction histidine kinase/ActR/RegA family two-component response regulator